MKLRVDPAALQELLDAEEYTEAEFGATVVNEFRTAVADALEEITLAPQRYPKKKKDIRSKVLLPYPYSSCTNEWMTP